MNMTLRQFRKFLARRNRFNAPSWSTWWAVLLGAFGEKLTDEEAAIFAQFTGREFTPDAAYRLIAAFIGRRGGKDNAASIIVVFLALCREWKLAPGETAVVMLLAVDRDQAGVAFGYIKGLLDSVPELAAQIENITKDCIALCNGVEIQVATADQAAVRGRTVVAAVCDEFSFWQENDAIEVPRALRPAMLTQPNAKLIVISSIYASYGPAFELFRQWGEADGKRLVIKGRTVDFNPTVPQEEIDAELRADPVGAGAEYLTIPRSDVARFIDEALLDPLTRTSPRELPWIPASANGAHFVYYAGVDVSGGRGDSTAAAVARQDGDKVIICAVRHWPAPHDPLIVAKEVAEFLKGYHLTHAVADQYGAEVVRSVYREAGVELMATELSRSDTYLAVLPLLTTGRIELSDDPTLRRELIGLERRTGRGKDVIDHGPHAHDDAANAVALAAHCANHVYDDGPCEIYVEPTNFFDGYIGADGRYTRF
jgi:hypothetical protein